MSFRTAWKLHGICTPPIPMGSRVIRVYHYTNIQVMAAAVSTCRQRFTDKLARPFGVMAYQPAGSPYIERVRLPYTAESRFLCQSAGACQPAKTYRVDMLLWGGKKQRAVCPYARKKNPRRGSGKGESPFPFADGFLGYFKSKDFCNQLGFQPAPQFLVHAQVRVACFVIHGAG